MEKTAHIRNKIVNIIRWTLVGLSILVFGFLAVCSITFLSYYEDFAEIVHYRWQNPLFGLVFIGLFVALAYLLYRLCQKLSLSIQQLRKIGFWLIIALGVAWILLARCQPHGEPDNLLYCVRLFRHGENEPFQTGGYLFRYPFQLGYIALLEGLYTIFGPENHMAVYVLHLICLAAVYSLSVRICAHLFKDNMATGITVLLMLGCVYLVIFITFLYGILLGLALSLLAIWCVCRFWDTRKLYFLLLGGAAQALAILAKSNYSIFAVGLGLVLLVDFIQTPNRAVPIALVVFVAFLNGFTGILHAYYESRFDVEINEGVPSIVWVSMGLDETCFMAPGWYTGETLHLYEDMNYDRQATVQVAQENIAQRLTNMTREGTLGSFFFKKITSQWNEPTMGCFLPSVHLPEDTPAPRSPLGESLFYGHGHTVLLFIMDKVHMLVYCGALLCVLVYRKRLSVQQMLPFVILFGGLLFHTFWEGKSQYIACYFVLAIPYAAAGYAFAVRWVVNRLLPRLRQKVKSIKA